MSLWWLEPGWTDACCAQCGSKIWPEGDPDWGICWPCMEHQTLLQEQEREAYEREQYEAEQRQLENEEMERHYREHPHG